MEAQRSAWRTVRRGIVGLMTVIGILATLFLVTGLNADVNSFDETSGGYEYPYEGWTGTPINYDTWLTTDDGMFVRGRVIDLYVDCSTGVVRWSFLGLGQIEWRPFSDRAKVVHQPQVSCEERGFDVSAWEEVEVSAQI